MTVLGDTMLISLSDLENVYCIFTSREHLRKKVTPDLHLTYSKNGEIWDIEMIKSDIFQDFSLKPYFVDIY